MPAFLEPVVWVLRFGPNTEGYGDPYTASATVVSLGNGECEIRGMTRQASDRSNAHKLRREVEECLRQIGMKKWHWDRRKSNVRHVVGNLTKEEPDGNLR